MTQSPAPVLPDDLHAPGSEVMLRSAPLLDLARALGSRPEGTIPARDVYWIFLELRDDAPDALIEAAGVIHEASIAEIQDPAYREQLRATTNDHRAQVTAMCALHKLAAAGRAAPESLDAFVHLWAYDPETYDGFDVMYRALAHLPKERLRAVIERSFDEYNVSAIPIVALVPEPDLVDRALALFARHCSVMFDEPSTERDARVLGTLTRLGRDVVPALREAFGRFASVPQAQKESVIGAAVERIRVLDGTVDPRLERMFEPPPMVPRTEETPTVLAPKWSIAALRKLAKASIGKGTKTVRVYVLLPKRKKPTAKELDRIAGAPIGISADEWPKGPHEPMRHVLSLDLAKVPELADDKALSGVRTLSLFITDADEGVAHEPGNDETKIVHVNEAAVKTGSVVCDLPYVAFATAGTFSMESVDVPRAVFDEDADEGPFDPLRRLLRNAPGRLLGEPMWMQAAPRVPASLGRFLFQFNSDLVDLNLGDLGEMYVFENGAFWRSN